METDLLHGKNIYIYIKHILMRNIPSYKFYLPRYSVGILQANLIEAVSRLTEGMLLSTLDHTGD